MNAGSVWIGHEYAYVSVVRRRYFPSNARRVKVLSLKEYQQAYKTRKDTYAQVEFLDNETGNTTTTVREVNVRNLYDFWDSYQDERQAHIAKREAAEAERQERYRKQTEEREQRLKEEAARAEAIRLERRRIADQLAYKLGLDTSAVNVQYENVTIKIEDLRFLLHG